LAGWYDEVVDLSKSQTVACSHGEYGKIYLYPTELPNEYFLVENRTQNGLDGALPASGLAIYHCDILGSNEWQGGTADEHYQVGLLQADGHLDLENNRNNGDSTDLFGEVSGVALSSDTSPSTLMWDGSASGLVISDISAPGQEMTFQVGENDQPQLVAENDAISVDIELQPGRQHQSTMKFSMKRDANDRQVAVEIEGFSAEDAAIAFSLEGPAGVVVHLGTVEATAGDFKAELTPERSDDPGKPTLFSKGTWKLVASTSNGIPAGRLHQVQIKAV
jgi:hypothetical protein